MDTGKILMGTALLLIMIGLVIHPAEAAPCGEFSCNLHEWNASIVDCGYSEYVYLAHQPVTIAPVQNADTVISDNQ